MIYLHLLWIVLFKPVVLVFFVIVDEVYGEHPCDEDGAFANPSVVEPSLYPPLYAVSVWIYRHLPRNVEGLYVYVKVGKWVYLYRCSG